MMMSEFWLVSRTSGRLNMIGLVSVRVAPSIAMPGTWAALLLLKEGPIAEADWMTNFTLQFTAA